MSERISRLFRVRFRTRFRMVWFGKKLFIVLLELLSYLMCGAALLGSINMFFSSQSAGYDYGAPALLCIGSFYACVQFARLGLALGNIVKALSVLASIVIERQGLDFYLFHPLIDLESGETTAINILTKQADATSQKEQSLIGLIWSLSSVKRKSIDMDYAIWHRIKGGCELIIENVWIDEPMYAVYATGTWTISQSAFNKLLWICMSILALLCGYLTLPIGGFGIVVPPLIGVVTKKLVHELSFSAAYYKLLTDKWPW